jgi:lipoprotein NlpD
MGSGDTATSALRKLVVGFIALAVTGCTAYRGREPISEAQASVQRRHVDHIPLFHAIVRGDTLFSIAWRYGLDYRQLAVRNKLSEPYRIYAGRRLVLRPFEPRTDTGGVETASGRSGRQETQERRTDGDGDSLHRTQTAGSVGGGGHKAVSGIDWRWPVRGQVTAPAPDSDKFGVEILGQEGAAVRAAAPGEVVYSGDRLVGYGKLIIIRHNDAYLSAYGHNRKLMVSEGLKVAAGQQIAEMGSSGTDKSKLYFEIRRNGKPVPPLDYLP